MVSSSRRRLLRAIGGGAGVAATGVLAGCGSGGPGCDEPTPAPASPLPDAAGSLGGGAFRWPTRFGDAANTASVPPAGPGGDVVRRWRADPDLGGAGETWVVAVGDRAYVAGREGGAVVALDVTDGSVVWRYDGVRDTGVQAVAPGEGLVLVTGRRGLQAVTVADGERVWGPVGPALDATDAVLVDGGTAYVAGRESVLAVDVANGDVRWRVDGTQLGAVAGDRVLAGEGVRALRASDGRELWSVPDVTLDRPVSVAGGEVYVGEPRRVTAYALADGSRRWRHQGGDEKFGVPAVAGDRVVAGTGPIEGSGGNVYGIVREGGNRRWCDNLGTRPVTVAAGDGVAYLAAADTLAARRVVDGVDVWTHRDPDREYGSLAVAERALLAGAHGGRVDAFGER